MEAGGKSFGSMRYWQPVGTRYNTALVTTRKSALRGLPRRRGGGTSGTNIAHSRSVMSLA